MRSLTCVILYTLFVLYNTYFGVCVCVCVGGGGGGGGGGGYNHGNEKSH